MLGAVMEVEARDFSQVANYVIAYSPYRDWFSHPQLLLKKPLKPHSKEDLDWYLPSKTETILIPLIPFIGNVGYAARAFTLENIRGLSSYSETQA